MTEKCSFTLPWVIMWFWMSPRVAVRCFECEPVVCVSATSCRIHAESLQLQLHFNLVSSDYVSSPATLLQQTLEATFIRAGIP